METTMKEKSLKHKIKEMESAQREKQQAPADPEQILSFDQWWVMTSKRLSLKPSLKEIMWADFNARGIKKEEPAARYNEGLRLFGL